MNIFMCNKFPQWKHFKHLKLNENPNRTSKMNGFTFINFRRISVHTSLIPAKFAPTIKLHFSLFIKDFFKQYQSFSNNSKITFNFHLSNIWIFLINTSVLRFLIIINYFVNVSVTEINVREIIHNFFLCKVTL